jgi:sphinganine-1-phosphate aldolase
MQVIQWVANMMSEEGSGVVGSLSSGGTESIILACKAHRDRAKAEGRCLGRPEIIGCTSAHAALDKACDLMGIKLVKVPAL